MKTEITKVRGWWKHLLLLCVTLLGAIGFATAASPNYPFPNNYPYAYGTIYTGSDVQTKIQSLYTNWKSKYYEESGNEARVKFVQGGEDGSSSVSEGIAYGMLITVYMDNATNQTQSMFDKLWNYYKANANSHGVMNWKVTKFTHQVTAPTSGNSNGATDADLDAAQALLMAYKQWGDSKYLTAAQELIGVLWSWEVNSNKQLKPGDCFDDYKNPCYFITNAMKLFTQVKQLQGWSNNWDWNTVASNCYTLMNKVAHSSTGLIPDWCNENGTTLGKNLIDGKFESIFGYDAARIPWRMAQAYAWYGDNEAKAIASKITSWAKTAYPSPNDILDGYFLDGTPGNGTDPFKGSLSSWGTSKNATFKAGLSIGAMVDASFNSYRDLCWQYGAATDSYGAYYTHTTQLLYMLCLTGNMPNFWDMNPVFLSAETNSAGSGIVLNFSKPIDGTSASSSINKFTVTTYPTAEDAKNKTNGSTISVSSASVSSKVVTLTMESEIMNPYIFISYNGTSLLGTDNSVAATFADKEVTNKITNMEPYPTARYTSQGGGDLFIAWSKDVKISGVSPSDFTVKVNGSPVSAASEVVSYVDDEGVINRSILQLKWDQVIVTYPDDIITISYVGGLTSTTGTRQAKPFTDAAVTNLFGAESCMNLYDFSDNKGTERWEQYVTDPTNKPSEVAKSGSTYDKVLYFKAASDERLSYALDIMNDNDYMEWTKLLKSEDSRLKGRIFVNSIGTGEGLAIFLLSGKASKPGYHDNNAAYPIKGLKTGEWFEFDIPLATNNGWNYNEYNGKLQYKALWFSTWGKNSDGGYGEVNGGTFEIYVDYMYICPKKSDVVGERGKVSFDGKQVELKFSTPMKVPTSTSAIVIKEGNTVHTVSSIEAKDGDASKLIFYLDQPITSAYNDKLVTRDENGAVVSDGNTQITASFEAVSPSPVKSSDGRPASTFEITLENLLGMTTSTGWYDHFADASDYTTGNISTDGVYVSSTEVDAQSRLDVTWDGSATWAGSMILSTMGAGYVMDLTENATCEFLVKADKSISGFYRIDAKDYFGTEKTGTVTPISLTTSYQKVSFDLAMTGLDKAAIAQVTFRFFSDKGSAATDWVPTIVSGTLSFDYISIGKPLYLYDFTPATVLDTETGGIDENASFTVTSSCDGYVFTVRDTVSPQYSTMAAAAAVGAGYKAECTAGTPVTINMNGLGYGYFTTYAYDPITGSVSSKYGCQVKDIRPPKFLEYFGQYDDEPSIPRDCSLNITIDENATVYFLPWNKNTDYSTISLSEALAANVSGGEEYLMNMKKFSEAEFPSGTYFVMVAVDQAGNRSNPTPNGGIYIEKVALSFTVGGGAFEFDAGEVLDVDATRKVTAYLVPSDASVSYKKLTQTPKPQVLEVESRDNGYAMLKTDELIITEPTSFYVYVIDLEEREMAGPSQLITLNPVERELTSITTTATHGQLQVSAGCEPGKFTVNFDDPKYINKNLTFSGADDIADIEYDPSTRQVTVTGAAPGTRTLTIASVPVPTVTTQVELTVIEVPATLEIFGDATMIPDNTEPNYLSIKINGKDATNDMVYWTSSNENVVEVSDLGIATGQSTGTATITATTKEFGCTDFISQTFDVTVTEAGLVAIKTYCSECEPNDAAADAQSVYEIDLRDPDTYDKYGLLSDAYSESEIFTVRVLPKAFATEYIEDEDDFTLESSDPSVAYAEIEEYRKNLKIYVVATGKEGIAEIYIYALDNRDVKGVIRVINADEPCDAEAPTASSIASATPCDNIKLTATASGTAKWYDAATDGNLLKVGANYTLGQLAAGTYTYYVANDNNTCESERIPVTVTVTAISAPASSELSAENVSTDDDVVLSYSGSGTAVWYTAETGGSALYSGNTYNAGKKAADTYTYYVAKRDENSCESTARTAVSVTVSQAACKTAAPTASEVPDVTVCEGNDATLKATFSGSATAVWYEVETGGASVYEGNTFATGVTAVGPKTYYVAKMDGCESESRTEVTLTITAKPSAVIANSILDEYCATVESVTLGATPSTGTWSGTGVSGTTFSPKTAGSGDFTLTYTIGETGCQNEYTKSVHVTAAPEVKVTVPESMCSGDAAATLTATPSTGTWSGTGVTGSSFDPSKGSSVVTYTYTEGSCEVVKESEITVTNNPTPKISGLAESYCSNDAAVTMTAAPEGGAFKVNAVDATSFNPATATVGENTVTYVVSVGGCEGTAEAKVTVKASPSIDLSGVSTSACAGESVTLAPTTGTWQGTGVNGTTFVSSTADTYELTYTEVADGCSASETVDITVTKATAPIPTAAVVQIGDAAPVLTAEGSGTIKWYDSEDGASVAEGTSYPTSVSTETKSTTTFYVTNTDGNCESDKVPVTVTVTDCMTPAPTISDVDDACEGETVTLSATGTSVKWYDASEDGNLLGEGADLEVTAAGTYFASQNAGTCESARASKVVSFKSKPAAPTATGASSCAGAELVAMTTVESANWYAAQDGAALATATKSFVPTNVTETTTFYVNQTVAGCTSDFAEVTYTVKATPDAPTTIATSACIGTEADYKVSATGTGLQWYDANNSPLGTDATQAVSGVTTAKDYSYTVTQTVDGCTSAAATATLTVNALPTPEITLDAEYCVSSEVEVPLAANPVGGSFTIDSRAATNFVPKTLGEGTFTVGYSYKDENGCTGVASEVTFTVKDCSDPAVTSVTLNKSDITLTAGDTYSSFVVTILPAEGIYNKTVAWESSNESVVTVSANGELKAVAEGTAVITVKSTYTEGMEATCNVKVVKAIVPVSGVEFAAGVPTSVESSSETDLSGFVTINPEGATDPEITWSVSPSTNASIENGVLTAGAVKTNTNVTVTVTVTAGGVTKTANTTITILKGPIPVTGITVKAPQYAQENSSFKVTADVDPEDADDVTFKWSVSNSNATIDQQGTVSVLGNSGDSFDVIATANDGSGVTGKATITIVDQIFPVESVTIAEGEYSVTESGTLDLSEFMSYSPSYASIQSIVWSTTSSYITVDETSGLVSGKSTSQPRDVKVTVTVTTLDGVSKSATVTVKLVKDPKYVSAISIESSLSKEANSTFTMKKAVLTPTDPDDATYTWSIKSGTGGTIDPETGVVTVTGVEGDQFVIVATANDINKVVSNECTVTVLKQTIPVQEIIASMNTVEVTAGGESQTITISYDPANTSQTEFTLRPSSSIFSYVDNGNGTITITGNQGGKATLTIKSTANASVMKTIEINVTELVKSIVVSGNTSLYVGGTAQLSAVVGESTATNKAVTWTSSDPNIATVSATGLVTALSAGMVQITATAADGSDIAGYTYVTINTIPVTQISVSDVSIQSDQTATIKATITPSNATNKTLIYSGYDESIITVDENGVITPIAEGTTTVTVSAAVDNVSKVITVTVTPVRANKDYLIQLIENETWGAYSIFYKVEDGTIRVGLQKGCVSPVIFNEFKKAWMDAQDVRYEEFASQAKVDAAAKTLYDAIVAMGADVTIVLPDAVEDVVINAKVYPTKVTNVVTVEADNMISVKVVSATGKVVAQEETAGDAIEINAAGFAQGVYKVIVETQNGTVVKGFVK
ncbi:MAG: Ig-like domain-containing protein [Bacteroidales bacterium]|nr:Ig-like domain-containing protein [Bacteroidales bacterium]